MGNLLQRHQSKFSTVSHPLSRLKCFPGNSFESKDSFCCTILGATMKSHKWCKSEALCYDRTTRSKTYWQSTIQFAQTDVSLKSFKFLANNLDIHFTWTYCILMIFLMCICRQIKVQHMHLVNWYTRSYLAL